MNIFLLWLLKKLLPAGCNMVTLVGMLVVGRESQLEVQNNLNMFKCNIISA